MSELNKDIQALEDLINQGQKSASLAPDGIPYAIVKQGYAVQTLEHLLPRPVLRRAKPIFTNLLSFLDYVNEQKTDASRIYVTNATQFICVLDHFEPAGGKSDWRQHRATLTLTFTPEWALWSAKNNAKFGQREFAQFIEENQDDISTPSGADLLDLVRIIKATQTAEFNGAIDEKDGNFSVAYQQATRNAAGAKGTLELPQRFTLDISCYEGSKPLVVEARLRFEITSSNKLNLWYELIRADRVLKKSLASVSDTIENATEITVWYGTP